MRVRLLTVNKIKTLLPAVQLFSEQNSISVEVRSVDGLHDRYMFVDKKLCYQSGASFKDGAKKSPTAITQITDAFDAMLTTYERKWEEGKTVFSRNVN